jgi:crotonobetainyl-CoA:carnitine CoA-transferase CaiB-like acyl-CoA transferase
VQTDDEWQSFCKVIGNPPWTKDTKFHTLLDRKKNENEINKLIEDWTIERDAKGIERLMQEVGVPAGVVNTNEDLFNDPQINHRHHFWEVEHSEFGKHLCEGSGFILSRTPGKVTTAGSCVGEYTVYVCTQILGMSDEEFSALYSTGLFV